MTLPNFQNQYLALQEGEFNQFDLNLFLANGKK